VVATAAASLDGPEIELQSRSVLAEPARAVMTRLRTSWSSLACI